MSRWKPQPGVLQVAKLYNCGFIFRTSQTCLAVDLCIKDAFYNDGDPEWFAEHIDALLTTHAHGDHFDVTLLLRMSELEKPMIIPGKLPGMTGVRFKQNCKILDKDMDGKLQLLPGVSIEAAMGYQGNEPCLLYHINMDGWKIGTVGDNSLHEYETFYETRPRLDVIIAPVFQGMSQLFSHTAKAPGNSPILYLSAHENEFHHPTNNRILLLLISAQGCKKSTTESHQDAPQAPLPSKITVTSVDGPVETWSFTYDDNSRLSFLTRTINGDTLKALDLKYIHGSNGYVVTGGMYGDPCFEFKVKKNGNTLSYNAADGWEYSIGLDGQGMIKELSSDTPFSSQTGNYESSYSYSENYIFNGPDVSEVERGCSICGKAGGGMLSMDSSSSLVTTYSYYDFDDRQNFNSFIFDCPIPVWFASSLPGCRHLVKEARIMSETQKFFYITDKDGNILIAERSYFNNDKEIIHLTYKFEYPN